MASGGVGWRENLVGEQSCVRCCVYVNYSINIMNLELIVHKIE